MSTSKQARADAAFLAPKVAALVQQVPAAELARVLATLPPATLRRMLTVLQELAAVPRSGP